jgi:PTS system galactitol-specific IIA component
MSALENLLVESAILLNYEAKDAADVVNELGKRLFEAGYTKESFVEAALEREKKMPTGLPLNGKFNAAIPHTDVVHVVKSGVAFATLTETIAFKNMVIPDEDVPVSLVFLLALDQPKAQIEMLQEIAGVLQDPQLIEALKTATEAEEVVSAIKNR